MAHGSGRLVRSFASMRQRDFRYLTLSTVSLGFGQWFQQIGLNWLVFQVTGSATQMGAITFLRGIMILAASLPAGVLSDRFSRRDVIVACTGVGVVQAVVLAVLVGTGLAEPWHLYIFAVIEGLATGVNQPARQAFVYDVTDRELLTNAMTVNSIAQNVARVSGPPLAGVIIGAWGSASVFFALAALKVLAMALTMLIRTRAQVGVGRKKESAMGSIMDGLRYSLGNRLTLALLIATTITPVLVYPYIQFMPVFAKDVLGGGPQTYGLLASGLAWGSLAGLAGLAYLGDVPHKGRIFIVTHVGYVVLLIAFARSEVLALSMACLIVSGVFHAVMQVVSNTLFQLVATNEMRGRVMALHGMSSGLQPAGALPMGIAIERWGAPNTVTAYMSTALIALIAVVVLFPELRRTEKILPTAATPEAAGGMVQAAASGRADAATDRRA